MAVLFIDDVRTPAFDAVVVRNLDEAFRCIDNTWDEVWLDHDLGGEETIRPLVKYIYRRAQYEQPLPIRAIYVHTMNPVGAEWMVSVLSKYYNVQRVLAPGG